MRWYSRCLAALHDSRQCGVEAAVGQDGRGDTAHDVAQLGEGLFGVVMGFGDQCLRRGQVVVEFGLGQPDGHRQRNQPRLHAVMQVALDAVAFGLR